MIRRVLAVSLAFGAAVVAAPAASAEAELEVAVTVTNKGNYTASLCGFDWLGGYCHFDIKSGESTEFTVYPRSNEDLVWARVVPDGGHMEEVSTVASKDEICFVSAGTTDSPTLEAVDCV